MTNNTDDLQDIPVPEQVVSSEIMVPPEGDTVGLILNLESGGRTGALLRLDQARELAVTALSACQALEDRQPADARTGHFFNVTAINIRRGTRADEAHITVQSGEGRIRLSIDLDLFVAEMAALVPMIKAGQRGRPN